MPPMLVNTSGQEDASTHSLLHSTCLQLWGSYCASFLEALDVFQKEKDHACYAFALAATQPNRTTLLSTFSCFACVILYMNTCLYEELPLCSSSDNFLSASAELPWWKHGKLLWEVAIPHSLCSACSSVVSVFLRCAWCQFDLHKLLTCKAIRHPS